MAGPSRIEEARRWLRQAQYDVRAAEWSLQGGFHDTACFLAQQAAEKALKSVHYFLGTARRVLLTLSVETRGADDPLTPALAALTMSPASAPPGLAGVAGEEET